MINIINYAQDYNIPGTDITLKKEDMIGIPSAGLHHDEAPFFMEPLQGVPELLVKVAGQ